MGAGRRMGKLGSLAVALLWLMAMLAVLEALVGEEAGSV